MSNKDTIIEALTMQLKVEREGNLALVKRIAELEKPVYVDSSRFSKGPSDHKPGMVITEPVHARPVVHAVRCTYPQCQATNGCVGACSKTAPPKREWVGFTHEELAWLNEALNLGGRFAVIEAIEAKLKEKNNG